MHDNHGEEIDDDKGMMCDDGSNGEGGGESSDGGGGGGGGESSDGGGCEGSEKHDLGIDMVLASWNAQG
eukprot:13826278-Heterocapsa_arctica.AAC.1